MASSSDHVKEESTEKDNEYPCGPCKKKKRNVTVDASFFCPTCDTCYCNKCCICGHDVIGSSNKQLWNKGTATRDHRLCVRHPGQNVKLYCKLHDQICCEVCLSTDHRFCLKMTDLKDMKEDMATEQNVEEIKSGLGQLQTKLEILQADRVTRVDTVEKSFNKCLDKVGQFRRKAKAAFDDIETNLSKYRRTYLDRFAGDQTINKTMLQTLSAYKTQFERSDEQHLLFEIKSCKTWVGRSSDTLTKMNAKEIRDCMVPISEYSTAKVVSEIVELGKVKLSYDFNSFSIRVEEDTVECVISGICQMHDGNFILTDSANRRLKKLDKSYKVVGHYQLDTEPRGVCCVSDKDVAVAMDNSTVQMRAVDEKFELTLSVSTGRNDVYGVVATNQTISIVVKDTGSYGDPVNYCNYSRIGDKIQLTNTIGLNLKSYLSSFPLTTLKDGSRFYLALNNKLLSFNKEGEPLATKEIKTPSGVCVDEFDNVYVSENGSNRILKLDKKCDWIGVVVKETDGFTDPGALCFDRNVERLVVAKKKGDFIYLV